MYLGWVRAGAVGATLTGLAFVLPSFLMVFALAALYIRFGGMSWIEGAFYGISAAVIAIIARSAYKLTKLTLAKDVLLWGIFAVSAAFTAVTRNENVLLFLGSGLLVLLIRAFPRRIPTAMLAITPWFITGLSGPADRGTLMQILLYGSGRVRVRQRPGDCAVSTRGRGPSIPLAKREAVSGFRCDCHDHARPSGHHVRIYRLTGGQPVRRLPRVRRCVYPAIFICSAARAILSKVWNQPESKSIHRRSDRRRHRRNRRSCDHPRSTGDSRLQHGYDLRGDTYDSVLDKESTGAGLDFIRRSGRHPIDW